MTGLFDSLPSRRAIIDRRKIADALNETLAPLRDAPAKRAAIVTALKDALASGRDEVNRRLLRTPTRGRESVTAQAFLMDQLTRILFRCGRRPCPSGQQSDCLGARRHRRGGRLWARRDGAL